MGCIEALVEPTAFDHDAPPRLESRPWSFAGLGGGWPICQLLSNTSQATNGFALA